MKLELKIEKVAHGGVFVARPEGKVVLVHGALPGETVLAEITEDAKSFRRADVVKVIEPSRHRLEHFWPVALAGAGGAEFGHIQLDYQRVLKAEVLAEALERMAGLKLPVAVLPADDTGLNYRTRIQLHGDKHGRLGVKRRRSDEVIAISSHPLALGELNDSGVFAQRYSQGDRVEIAVDQLGNISKSVNGKSAAALTHFSAGSRKFNLSPGTFWQAHFNAPELLVGEVLAQLRALGEVGRVLDLYSGAGLFASNVAEEFDVPVTAVENSAAAIASGKKSAADLKQLQFQQSDVLRYLRSEQSAPDTLLLDPPRSGAATKVTLEIIRLQPKKIVYVACDPIALARDLKLLSAAGYQIAALQAFDIFPQTHHFETVVSLRLSNL